MRVRVDVRCYAELNEFLPAARRHRTFEAGCDEGAAVKDLLEGLGVPHTEIDLLLVNGEPATFFHGLRAGDRVTAYPVFEAFDVGGVTRVRATPLREVRFVLDGHLRRLASLLRLAGFDAVCPPGAADAELAAISAAEARILLTRDQALLKRRAVTHGSYVHATAPPAQLREVVRRFQLGRIVRPFTRCMRCNGPLEPATPAAIAGRVPPRSRARYDRFLQCQGCGRMYWEGTHYPRLKELMETVCRQDPRGG